MTAARRRPHTALLVLLLLTVAWGAWSTHRRMSRPGGRWVGYTECSWIGAPRVFVRSGLRAMDSQAVAAHESVHAAQCLRLGPLAYRWNTLFASTNLRLETPAYCAGGRVRAALSRDTAFVRATIPIDMLAAMGDAVDSAAIAAALRQSCPELTARR